MDGRDYLVVTDELFGARGNGYCPGGGLHIYDITNELAPIKTSVFVPPIVNSFMQSGSYHQCTSHVLRIYEDQGIMTIAWYLAGTWVVDVSDPANFRAIGYGNATATDGRRANTWAAKLHNGYIYTNDLNRGVDIFRYLGPGPEVQATVETGLGPSIQTSSPIHFQQRSEALGRPLFCFDLS